MSIRVVSNNPLVEQKLNSILTIEYHDADFIGILEVIRNHVHGGDVLLTHPLSGSVKPNETPYKSVMIRTGMNGVTDFESVKLIESAITTAKKFIEIRPDYVERMSEQVKQDCQVIDYTLIQSALPSAGINSF